MFEKKVMKSSSIPLNILKTYGTNIHECLARKMKRHSSVLPSKIRKLTGVKREIFQQKLDS